MSAFFHLNIVLSRFNYVVAIVGSFLLLSGVSLFGPHFVCSPADGHLDCSQFGAIRNYTAMNFYIHVFAWTYVLISFSAMPRSGSVGPMVF